MSRGDAGPEPRRAGPAHGVVGRVAGASPATLLFCAALLLSGGLLLTYLSDLTFWRDEWAFILDRRGSGIDTYLDPFVEQLLAIPIAVYKVLIAAFGIESPIPFQIASTLVFLTSMALLFVYVRRRVGDWLALAGVLPILFLGPAWDDLLFPFQISFFGSVVLRDRRPARARSRGPPRRPDRLRAAGDRPLLLPRRDPVRGRGDRRHRAHPRAVPARVRGRDSHRAVVPVVPRLGPRRPELHLLPQLLDHGRVRGRRLRLEHLDPARARRPARRDRDHLARLGSAAARARGRRGGLADLAGGLRRAAAAALGGAGARALVLVADRPQRLVSSARRRPGATSTWG